MKKTRQNIALNSLEANTGQLDWLPKNPRQWTKTIHGITLEVSEILGRFEAANAAIEAALEILEKQSKNNDNEKEKQD